MQQRFYLGCIFAALCLNLLGTYLCTFFTMKLSFVPLDMTSVYLRRLGGMILLPNLLIAAGAGLFVIALPIAAKVRYGESIYQVSGTRVRRMAGRRLRRSKRLADPFSFLACSSPQCATAVQIARYVCWILAGVAALGVILLQFLRGWLANIIYDPAARRGTSVRSAKPGLTSASS